MKYLIYGLVDPRDNMIYYVGKSSTGLARPRQHRNASANDDQRRWIQSLGEINYDIVVLESISDPKCAEDNPYWRNIERRTTRLSGSERWWIALGRAMGWPLTNRTDGGEGSLGWIPSAVTRARIGEKSANKSAEVRAKISASISRYVADPEVRRRLRESTLKQRAQPNYIQPMDRPGAREKLSRSLLGHYVSPETIAKITEKNKKAWTPDMRRASAERTRRRQLGRKHSSETREKMRVSALAREARKRRGER